MAFYSFTNAASNFNSKTGHMHKCSAPAENCSNGCALKGEGCYAMNFPMALQWARQQAGEAPTSVTWSGLLAACRYVPRGEAIRVWEAGDFPMLEDGTIDVQSVLQMKNAVRGKRAFGYTHHNKLFPAFNAAVSLCREDGFTINVSIDGSEDDLDAVMDAGLPAVIAVSSAETRRQWRTAGGYRVRVCPNHTHKSVQCNRCMLCHTRPRDLAIAFPAHGTRYKAANKALQARSNASPVAQELCAHPQGSDQLAAHQPRSPVGAA